MSTLERLGSGACSVLGRLAAGASTGSDRACLFLECGAELSILTKKFFVFFLKMGVCFFSTAKKKLSLKKEFFFGQ
jgi:hypothetical protein